MYKELEASIPGFVRPAHGYLKAGRAGRTVTEYGAHGRAGQHSHASSVGNLTDKVISLINQHREGVVFLLWGSHAQKKGAIIDPQRHHILKARILATLCAPWILAVTILR